MERELVALKIGGRAAARTEILDLLIDEIALLAERYRFILVHGGGAEVTRVSRALGLEPEFRDGIRITRPEEMEIVDMVLSGLMNKRIVRRFQVRGVAAAGISGSDGALFTGESLEGDGEGATRTGRITAVRPDLIGTLLRDGYLPVIASTSMDGTGSGLNINADDAALALAAGLPASRLLFLSDIPGILRDGAVIREIDRQGAEREIAGGVISGGMIPKVRSSVEALSRGVGRIIIGEYGDRGDLAGLLEGRIGTSIVAAGR